MIVVSGNMLSITLNGFAALFRLSRELSLLGQLAIKSRLMSNVSSLFDGSTCFQQAARV